MQTRPYPQPQYTYHTTRSSGQRVKVTDIQGTQYFLYDGLMPVLELDAGKNTTASYVYGANGVIYRRLHLPGGDEYEYHHVNALGSVAIITDDNETVVARYEYDAFGAVRHQWGIATTPASSQARNTMRM